MNFEQARQLAELVRWMDEARKELDTARTFISAEHEQRLDALARRLDALEAKRKPGRPRKADAS